MTLLKACDKALVKGTTYEVALSIGRRFVGTYRGVVLKTLLFEDRAGSRIYLDPSFIYWIKARIDPSLVHRVKTL
jgi:hypothetical protein